MLPYFTGLVWLFPGNQLLYNNTHLEYPIDMGKVDNGIITCPFHKYRFKLDTGKCLNSPDSLESYPVKIEGDRVFVDID